MQHGAAEHRLHEGLHLWLARAQRQVAGSPALNVKSQTAISNGDEAGNAGGGVVSNKFIGKGEFIKGSAKVTLEGKAAVSQGATTKHNDGNTVGLCSVAAQAKVDVA